MRAVLSGRYRVPARTANTSAELELLAPSSRRVDAKAAAALKTRAAALKATWTSLGALADHKDCTSAATNAMTTSCEKLQQSIASSRNMKFGDSVLSIPGMRTLRAEETAAKPMRIRN